MKKRRKQKFYASGIISLTLIPLLCFYYISQNFKTEKIFAINTLFINEQSVKNKDPNAMTIAIPPDRKFISDTINGKVFSDIPVFKCIEKQILKLSNVCDTVNGIHVHFSKNARYAEFVRVIDFCQASSIDFCIPYKNDIYVVIPNSTPIVKFPHLKHTEMHCGGSFGNDVIPIEPEKKKAPVEYFNLPSQEIMQKLWPLACIYAWLFFLTFGRKRISKTDHLIIERNSGPDLD